MKKVKKAGCILINRKDNTIALVYRKKYNDYSFPKGHLEEGETIEECALRETAEETKHVARFLEKDPIYISKVEGMLTYDRGKIAWRSIKEKVKKYCSKKV